MVERMKRYSSSMLKEAIGYYRRELKPLKSKTTIVLIPLKNKRAYYSLPALSNAVHEMNGELNVKVIGRKNESMQILEKFWTAFDEIKKGKETRQAKALKEFIRLVNRKTKSRAFEKIFKRPEFIITAKKNAFEVNGEGKKFEVEFNDRYFREYRFSALKKTCRRIINQYAVRKNEVFGISFELIPKFRNLDLPLQDYMDNFAIARAFALEALNKSKDVSLGSGTKKASKLATLERTSDLMATISGCYYDKDIKEPIFKAFKKTLKAMKIKKVRHSTNVFGVVGKGYGGKHFFGMNVGYPDPKKRTRWMSPSSMRLKSWWYSQTALDDRMPSVRLAVTETLPIDNFIKTCDVDYKMLYEKSRFIKGIVEKGVRLYVKGNKSVAGFKTDMVIDLKEFKTGKYTFLIDDGSMQSLYDKEQLRKNKVKAGTFGNFPAGECFMTPNKIDGTLVSDIVINLDQSYVIPKNKPIVIKFRNGKYKVVKADRKIIKVMKKEKKESLKLIRQLAKAGTTPKKIINEYLRNFDRVGEFSINTNPKAGLSRYLIETEKMARMMHLAIGSGFEPGRQTTYHSDTVINSVAQKMDVYVVDEKGERHFIIKKGNLQFNKK